MCGSLISLAKFATDLRKLKIHLALTFSSLDWHGSCSVDDLIQMGFLLQKFWIQYQLPVFFGDSVVPLFELADLQQKGQRGSQLSRFPNSCRTYHAS